MGMPVVLSDSILLTSGQANNLNAAKMQPASRRAFFVREFLFIITAPSAANPFDQGNYQSFGAFIRAQIKMGPHALMTEPQPIWALAPPRHWVGGSFRSLTGAFVAAQRAWTSFDRWVLPKPMFVPGNAGLDILLSRGTDIDTNFPGLVSSNFEARVAVIGEYADKIMPVSDVPFVSSFFPEAGRMYSNDRELKNTLDRDIELQRFIGRIFNNDATFGFGAVGDEGVNSWGGSGTTAQQTIKIQDPQNYYVTGVPYGGFAPFNNVFPWNGRTWTFKKLLQPGQNFHAALGVAPTVSTRPLVSLVGSRKERV